MNDFTKEELYKIFEIVVAHFSAFGVPTNELIEKIESMIDNYCEHEPSDKFPNKFKWQLCNKCGKDYKQ